jgi:hypothetical protein
MRTTSSWLPGPDGIAFVISADDPAMLDTC